MDITTVTQPYAIATGSYVGDASANKAITHGLSVVPKLVILYSGSGAVISNFLNLGTSAGITYIYQATAISCLAVTASTSTSFYVGNAGDYTKTANANGTTYYWIAFP
jgi:hypothetical protein